TVQDVQGRGEPRLMMPSSRKGRGVKKVQRRPLPISASLAARLRLAAQGRPGTASLLVEPSSGPWRKTRHARVFCRAGPQAGLEDSELPPSSLTISALRHSSIVRQLINGVPIRIVAVNHDSSVGMLERVYSRFIADHSDKLSRQAMLDLDAPATAKVLRMRPEHVSRQPTCLTHRPTTPSRPSLVARARRFRRRYRRGSPNALPMPREIGFTPSFRMTNP